MPQRQDYHSYSYGHHLLVREMADQEMLEFNGGSIAQVPPDVNRQSLPSAPLRYSEHRHHRMSMASPNE